MWHDEARAMASVFDVAEHVLGTCGAMSAMKLQALCYRAQAWSFAQGGGPLFGERIEAWQIGPIVPALYERHRGVFKVGPGSIGGAQTALTDAQRETVDAVCHAYHGLNIQQLGDIARAEAPWREARARLPFGERGADGDEEITPASMARWHGRMDGEIGHDAKDVARHILWRSSDRGAPVSNPQLQRLLYLCWIDHHERTGEHLFEEPFVAFALGPVVPSVYHEWCCYGADRIFKSDGALPDGPDREGIDACLMRYEGWTVWRLSELVRRRGGAWDVVWRKKGKGATIDARLIERLGCGGRGWHPIRFARRMLSTVRSILTGK